MTTDFEFPKDVGFVCSKCARCCGDTEDTVRHVLLLKSEAERISKETLLDVSEFADATLGYEPYIYEMKKTDDKGKCIFLKDNRCKIYDIRPIICRFYPFELKNLGNNSFSFAYTTKCEGVGKGKHLEQEFFEHLFSMAMTAIDENIERD